VDKHGAKGAPDLVVEVISGSTGRLDLGPKKSIYAQYGVTENWAVYPREATVDVFRFAGSATEPAETLSVADTLRTPLLPGWEFPLTELFAQ